MKISDFLSPENVLIDVRGGQKSFVLQEMSTTAATASGLPAQLIYSELLKREELGSTGIGGGIALPHARVQGVKRPLGILAKLKKPIEFEAIDRLPVDIVFLILLSTPPENDHLVALALIARKLKASETLVRLREAKTASDLYATVTG